MNWRYSAAHQLVASRRRSTTNNIKHAPAEALTARRHTANKMSTRGSSRSAVNRNQPSSPPKQSTDRVSQRITRSQSVEAASENAAKRPRKGSARQASIESDVGTTTRDTANKRLKRSEQHTSTFESWLMFIYSVIRCT